MLAEEIAHEGGDRRSGRSGSQRRDGARSHGPALRLRGPRSGQAPRPGLSPRPPARLTAADVESPSRTLSTVDRDHRPAEATTRREALQTTNPQFAATSEAVISARIWRRRRPRAGAQVIDADKRARTGGPVPGTSQLVVGAKRRRRWTAEHAQPAPLETRPMRSPPRGSATVADISQRGQMISRRSWPGSPRLGPFDAQC